MIASHSASAVLAVVSAIAALGWLGGCRDRGDQRAAPREAPAAPGSDVAAQPAANRRTDPSAGGRQAPGGDSAIDPDAIVIGLDADMSSAAAEAGEAIRRGAILAIEEINERGGVLGRDLRLAVRDHRGNPARGVDNIEAFAAVPNLVAVLAGLHTPVALAELDAVHSHEIVFLVPWAAGTPIIDNQHRPSYAFRVSVRDEYAGRVMVEHALARGCHEMGLLLEQTLWGRSNLEAINEALAGRDGASVALEWILLGSVDLTGPIDSLVASGADCVLLVSNPLEGLAAIESMARLPAAKRRPILSHWGILGQGRTILDRLAPHLDRVDLAILQTFSFFNPRHPDRADRVFEMYCARFGGCAHRRDVFSPTGTVHAYELVHLLALAIAEAGSLDRPKIRDALERIPSHRGLIRDYEPPFAPDRHDALGPDDLQMCRLRDDGALVPVPVPLPSGAR